MDLTDEEELRRQRTGSRTTAHLDIAKTAEALRVGDPRGLQLAGHRSFVTVCYRRVPRGDDAVATLARRAANAGMFDLFREFCRGDASSYVFGREPDAAPSQPWRWEEPGQLELWAANKTAGRSPVIWPRDT